MAIITGIIGTCFFCFAYLTKTYLPPLPTAQPSEDKIQSPFNRTLGFVRWNSARLDRVPVIEKIQAFFFTICTIQLPRHVTQLNLTFDGWEQSTLIYKAVAETMQIILQEYPIIEGLLYFHFDVCIGDELHSQRK